MLLIVLSPSFSKANNHRINHSLVKDTAAPFIIVQPYDVVIDEIMADPSPLVGLPNSEWIELRNISSNEINLAGWKVGKPTGSSGPIRSFVLKPDSSVIICSSGSVNDLLLFGSVISVTSFPSLSNTGDLIFLSNSVGKIIHAINYSDNWYQNELKKQGGWSLEMIDLNNPCTGIENWSASDAAIGGTPGKINSIDAVNIDAVSPKLIRAYAPDSLHIILLFNEPLDSLYATNINSYNISDGIGIPSSVVALAPLFDKIIIRLNNPLDRNKIYTVSVNQVKDCIGNEIGTYNTARVGLYEPIDYFDIVINEILFNPKSSGVDYLELFNRSNKIINLKNVFIANLNALGETDNITSVSSNELLFFPKEYIVLTENSNVVQRDFFTPYPERLLQLTSLPSMNDDEGHVILLNEQGKQIDSVSYKDDWHFKLLENKEGIALERINCDGLSQDEHNWHSASSSNNFGTPTYKNSQSNSQSDFDGEINIEPKTISPDNDGHDDIATITYSFLEPGYVANITVFDANGRAVKQLQRNALCGRTGYFRWDGLNEKSQRPPAGIYILYTEVFNLQGKIKKFKKAIVIK